MTSFVSLLNSIYDLNPVTVVKKNYYAPFLVTENVASSIGIGFEWI